jgi:serine/threonine-protein kinase
MADPPAGAREGETLCGKYRLDKLLGEGGMGEVYRASNVLIGRDVAIKILRAEHAKNDVLVGRFLREARAANLVRHPNVVGVLDIGQDEAKTPFIVQELLEGEDLATRVEREEGKLPVDEALSILLPVIDAVATGHASGVVHRDLKPENVFLARVGSKTVPKLLDFGISKIQQAGPDDRKMTLAGTAMGTPTYMSPEQVKGFDVDARADVWAFGVMLYQLVSGTLPFDAESHAALFVKVCTEDPAPLGAAAPEVSRDLCEIVHKCLQRDKDARFADAAALALALREARPDLAVSQRPPSGARDIDSRRDAAAQKRKLEREDTEPERAAAAAVPKVPSLAPPAAKPAPPKPAPRAAAPPPPAAPSHAAPPPAPQASGAGRISLQSVRPTSARTIASAPRVEPRDAAPAAGVLVPLGIFAGGLVAGLIGALVAYESADGAAFVSAIAADTRMIAGLVLLVAGGGVAIGSYRRIRADAMGARGLGFIGSVIGAVLVFLAAKLLTA